MLETTVERIPKAISMILGGIHFELSLTLVGEIDRISGRTSSLQESVEKGLRFSSLKIAETCVNDAR